MNERIAKVLEGLDSGRITPHEADAYLKAACGTTLDAVRPAEPPSRQPGGQSYQSHQFTLAVILMIIIGVTAFMYYGNPTAFAVLDVPQENVTNGTYSIPPVLGLNITGVLYGDGNASVYFDTPDGTYLVGTIVSDDGAPRTEKASYDEGEPVQVVNAPADASYYFNDGSTSAAVDLPFAAASGEILIVTPDSTYRLPIIIGIATRATAFSELCVETCSLPGIAGTLRIETQGDSYLELTSVQGNVPNTPPSGTLGPLSIDATTAIDLDAHFTDPDGDELYYDVGASGLVNATIDGSTLTLAPLEPGSGYIIVYVSDLRELLPMTVELNVALPVETPQVPSNGTNGTADGTGDGTPVEGTGVNGTAGNSTGTNSTANATQADSGVSFPGLNATVNVSGINSSVDCTNPDPNQRPLECIQSNDSTFFKPEDLYLENKNAVPVGQLTPIGNLLIKGTWIERSTASPSAVDWVRGYTDADGDFVPTAWIDTASGDLHLRGTLTEANGNLVFEERYTAITNKRGIILALIDQRTGDMVLRGNIIPYRRTFG